MVPELHLTGSTCIWGVSEYGKSWLAEKMVQKAKPNRLVRIDPLARDGVGAMGVRDALCDPRRRVVVCNSTDAVEQRAAVKIALLASTPSNPVYCVADEAPDYLDVKDRGIKRAVLQGRHAGFGMLIIGQRPTEVLATYRTQAKATYWMRMQTDLDIQAARKSPLGKRAFELPTFGVGDYFRVTSHGVEEFRR